MSLSETAPSLNINEDFSRRFTVQGVRTTDGVLIDATGLTLSVRIALSRTGAALGALEVTATEFSGDAGFYHADFDTAALVSALTDYVGRLVYVIVKKTGDLDCVWWVYRVTTQRQAA